MYAERVLGGTVRLMGATLCAKSHTRLVPNSSTTQNHNTISFDSVHRIHHHKQNLDVPLPRTRSGHRLKCLHEYRLEELAQVCVRDRLIWVPPHQAEW
jgi:hypothetical protein